MLKPVILLMSLSFCICARAQNFGIGTITPIARLHVADSNVVFTGPSFVPNTTPYAPPVQEPGTRMLWYPQKAAFRAGEVDGVQWNKDNIGLYSFATAYCTIASGNLSTAIGQEITASGYTFSFAAGFGTKASGSDTTAMGYYTIARSDLTLVSGKYNDTTNTNCLFEIGNGTALDARSNAFTVLTNGNTGIGTTSKGSRFYKKY